MKKKGFLHALNRSAEAVEKTVNFCACVFLLIIAVGVIIQVLGREINIPVVWLGELTTYCLIWVVFFGLALGYRNGLFAQVDIICHLVPKSWKKYLQIFWDVTGLAIMTMVVWSSRKYIALAYHGGTLSPELRWPLYIVYLGPVIGYIVTGYFTIVNIINRVDQIRWGGTEEAG